MLEFSDPVQGLRSRSLVCDTLPRHLETLSVLRLLTCIPGFGFLIAGKVLARTSSTGHTGRTQELLPGAWGL